MAVFGLFFLAWQYIQYALYGVLPSHSHEGSLIRYGSYYDDSLVLGILTPMFAGYYLSKYQNKIAYEVIIIAFSAVAVVMTGGFTSLLTVFLFIALWFRGRHFFLVAFFCAVIFALVIFYNEMLSVWHFKQDSIAGHLSSWESIAIDDMGLINYLGIIPMDIFVEVGYLSFLYNYGVPVVALIVALHIYTLYACKYVRSNSDAGSAIYRFSGAAEGLAFSVLVVNMNLPPIVYPPIYLFVAIFSAIIIGNWKLIRLRGQ